MRDEKSIYWNIYKGYQDLYDYYKNNFRFNND